MQRQQSLAEAVVRQMDTHELVAMASGRRGGGGGLLSRGRGRASFGSQSGQTTGVNQVSLYGCVSIDVGRWRAVGAVRCPLGVGWLLSPNQRCLGGGGGGGVIWRKRVETSQ